MLATVPVRHASGQWGFPCPLSRARDGEGKRKQTTIRSLVSAVNVYSSGRGMGKRAKSTWQNDTLNDSAVHSCAGTSARDDERKQQKAHRGENGTLCDYCDNNNYDEAGYCVTRTDRSIALHLIYCSTVPHAFRLLIPSSDQITTIITYLPVLF